MDSCRKNWAQIWLTTCQNNKQGKRLLPPLRAEIEETPWIERNVRSFPKQTAQTGMGPSSHVPSGSLLHFQRH